MNFRMNVSRLVESVRALVVFTALLGQSSFAGDGYIALAGLSARNAKVLLECQASRTWTKGLLDQFSADSGERANVSIPVALFPVPLENSDLDSLDELGFDQWCGEHVTAAGSMAGGLRLGVTNLFPAEPGRELELLARKLAACARSPDASPVMRLCATAAVTNREPQSVRDSLLTALLCFANNKETHAGMQVKMLEYEPGRDGRFLLDELIESISALLKKDAEVGVLVEYVSLVNAGSESKILPGLGKVSDRDFIVPFLTEKGTSDLVFRLHLDRSPAFVFDDDEPREAMGGSVVVNEAQVLSSYRANALEHASTKVVYTISRFELARFFEQFSKRVVSEMEGGGAVNADTGRQIELLIARFLQVDDWSSIIPSLKLIEGLDRQLAHQDRANENEREIAMDALRHLLSEKAAEPREAFGVSLVDLYDVMKELREHSDAWEAALRRSK